MVEEEVLTHLEKHKTGVHLWLSPQKSTCNTEELNEAIIPFQK